MAQAIHDRELVAAKPQKEWFEVLDVTSVDDDVVVERRYVLERKGK